ncbi:MAG TPA: winged helix-turn-helix domain-containing protein [Candidatus Nanoarchaeia archaeon]|nr:winged helix-turn-helix domain-containing protein [Candidatus Nanoarchaeia archaeon]
MARKRTRLEIIRDMLQVIKDRNGKIKPTHILYKSNLSHEMMSSYLDELIGKGFIVEHKSAIGKRYSVTERGMEFLGKYHEIVEFTEGFGLG